jgi:hypothetical protein
MLAYAVLHNAKKAEIIYIIFYYKKIKISIKKRILNRLLFLKINVINLYLLKQKTFYINIFYYIFHFLNLLKIIYLK